MEINLPALKYTAYEIVLTKNSSGTQYNFPVNMYLTGSSKIYGVEVYLDSDITNSPISTSNPTWTLEMAQQATLTLHTNDPQQPQNIGNKGDWIKQLPVLMMHRSFYTNTTKAGVSVFERMLFGGLNVDWNKSYVNFVAPQTFSDNYSAVFGVYYKA